MNCQSFFVLKDSKLALQLDLITQTIIPNNMVISFPKNAIKLLLVLLRNMNLGFHFTKNVFKH